MSTQLQVQHLFVGMDVGFVGSTAWIHENQE